MVRQGRLQSAAYFSGTLGESLDEEKAVTFLARIKLEEIGIGEKKLALKHAVLQETGNVQPDLSAPFVLNGEFLAQAAMKDPFHGVGFSDHGDGAVVARLLQQQPGIGALLGAARFGFLELETIPLHQAMGHAEQARPARLVEVQTTDIVPRMDAEGVNLHVRKEAAHLVWNV